MAAKKKTIRTIPQDRTPMAEQPAAERARNFSEVPLGYTPELAVTGCSFGGYQAVNFALKHPDVVTHCVSMSGAFDIKSFLDGYYDDNVYFNNPMDYLSNLSDESYLNRYRQMKIVLGSADWDMCLDANVKMAGLMHAKGIPHWLDIWGDNSKHDWPLWQRMAGKYFY